LHSYNKPRRIRKNQQESSSVPLYEYQCKQCGHRFEKIQSFSAPEEKVCPECGGEVERLISAPAIQFKGAGWYVNDYAGRGKAPSDRSKGDGSKGDGKDVAAKSSEGSSKVEGGKSDSTSKSDSGAASSNSGSNAASAGSGSTAKSSD
jgi:putative FmdB family regulatory protein